MHGNIGLHGLALVSPQAFSERMDLHWTQTLDLCSSQPLRDLWRVMGQTFQSAIVETATGVQAPWRILQPPTGSGKTQGACVYAAMQADLNRDASGRVVPVGLMIVTRRIEQADEIAATINDLAGRSVAVAHHSKNRASPDQIATADALIITHQAYVNASHRLKKSDEASWSRLATWRGGGRLLTIIDEALANAIEENHVTASNLSQAIGYIPVEVRAVHGEQVGAIERLHRWLLSRAMKETFNAELAWDDAGAPGTVDLAPLRKAMAGLPYDRWVLSKNSVSDQKRIATKVDALLRDSEAILDRFAFYAKKGREHTLNSSELLIPCDVPGPVVLDATATANFLWDLFERRVTVRDFPERVRDYSTVTLHVARATGLGKGNMTKHIGTRFPRLLAALEEQIGPERSVFLCMHKATKHVAQTYSHHFASLEVGHWGAVDGRNDWALCDTAVIFGLPYRDTIWANNAFFALQGVQSGEWLNAPAWKHFPDVRSVMVQRQLSVSIIQAINRIRCRRVIDAEGRCQPADVFVVLPSGKLGDDILQDVMRDMPGAGRVEWAFSLDGPKVRRAPRKGSTHEALLSLMETRLPGETPITFVQRELRLEKRAMKRLQETLRDSAHVTTKALHDLGVEYVRRGAGRGARCFLVKHSPD